MYRSCYQFLYMYVFRFKDDIDGVSSWSKTILRWAKLLYSSSRCIVGSKFIESISSVRMCLSWLKRHYCPEIQNYCIDMYQDDHWNMLKYTVPIIKIIVCPIWPCSFHRPYYSPTKLYLTSNCCVSIALYLVWWKSCYLQQSCLLVTEGPGSI